MMRLPKSAIPGCLLLLVLGCLLGCSNTPGLVSAEPPALNGKHKIVPVDSATWHPLVYDSTKQYIYLTFDDGPQHGTVSCYDLCRKEGIKASFFMVGQHELMKSDGRKIVTMIRDAYPHTVLANHSFSHANNKYRDFYHHPDSALLDFLHAEQVLGIRWKIARLPGNRAWVREADIKATSLVRPVAGLLDSIGYNVIGWDLEWGFRKKTARPVQTPQQLARQVDSTFARKETHVPGHLVILTHDRMFSRAGDADSLAKFIQLLKQNPRYVFETVDHYPGLKKMVR
jgi:peptidoglycan/xylan/chitin deacetylase (PgdA/CDA1 family)